jgi:hypothetical protein
MKASPGFSRVARVNHGKLIYLSGFFGETPDDSAGRAHRSVTLDLITAPAPGGKGDE